ncbi:MAG TPA: metallophosphoesterase [Dongiaceae bacterium]|nr:metallophosphoesterase [Dongiaceae bacterium]
MKRCPNYSANAAATALADKYVSKWPNMPTHGLASKMHRENPGVFKDVEGARYAVRYRRGQAGKRMRAKRDDHDSRTMVSKESNPLGLPESDEIPYKPHLVDVEVPSRALILSDLHFPYYNLASTTAALEDGKKHDCSIVIFNGDSLDCYQISKFTRDARFRDLYGEVLGFKKLLDVVRKMFPNALIIFKAGNHEERLEHLISKVPEIQKLNIVDWPAILGFGDRGITYVKDKRPIKLGKLPLFHGHEFVGGFVGPVNPARGLYLKAKAACAAGHWHQGSEHSESTINDELVTCWSFGCLCELHPKYCPVNKWNHGFGIVEVDPNGEYRVKNKRIRNGIIF